MKDPRPNRDWALMTTRTSSTRYQALLGKRAGGELQSSCTCHTQIWRKHVVEESRRRRRVIGVEYGADDCLDAMSFRRPLEYVDDSVHAATTVQAANDRCEIGRCLVVDEFLENVIGRPALWDQLIDGTGPALALAKTPPVSRI